MNSQVRYNGTIYDILSNVNLGKYQYSIIGTGSNDKFFDIAFIEKIIENEKIRYIVPNNASNEAQKDSLKIISQALLEHIINDIKDRINQDVLLTRDDTIYYVKNCVEVLDQEDIKGLLFIQGEGYDDEQLDEMIKRINVLYDSYTSDIIKKEELSFENNEEPEQTVDDIYSELEKTQNFGISIIGDYKSLMEKTNDEYVSEPVDRIFEEKKEEENIKLESISASEGELENLKNDVDESIDEKEDVLSDTNASKLTIDDIKFMLEKKSDTMTLQQRLYWENELERLNSVPKPAVEQINNGNSYTLSNRKSLFKENAAYVSIYSLIALIGSFELLLIVIMLIKY